MGFRTTYNFSHTFLDGNLYTQEAKIHLQKELYFKDIFIRKCRSLRFCTFLQNLMVYKILHNFELIEINKCRQALNSTEMFFLI